MYRIKIPYCKTPLKRIYLLLVCCLLRTGMAAQTATYYKAESFIFSFKDHSDMFLADYGDNAYQLERMGRLLDASRERLLKGDRHLLIVSHVDAYSYEDESVVNEASLRANRIRAYLKTRFDIPHESVAFYIDRSGIYRDRVHVYEVYKPLPWFANLAIHYSESRYPEAVKVAIRSYGEVPYVDLYRRGEAGGYDREVYRIDDPLFDRSELEDYRLASVIDTLKDKEADPEACLATTVTTRERVRVVSRRDTVGSSAVPCGAREQGSFDALPARKEEHRPAFLSVKTNLLPWCGVAPSLLFGTDGAKIETGAFMPNLEVEWYFAHRWSVAVSGLYSDFAYGDKTRDRWSVSEFSVEPRVWPLSRGNFNWLHTGLFAEYGDFDVRGSAVSSDPEVLYGRTGRFWTLGASVGCLVPLGAGFCFEANVRAGYRSVADGKKYRYDKIDDKNYLEARFSSTGFMVGLKLSLAYRFQIR